MNHMTGKNLKTAAKGIFRLAAWWGTSAIVCSAVNAVVPKHNRTILRAIPILIAQGILVDIATDKVLKRADQSFNEFFDEFNPKKYKKIFSSDESDK